MRTFKISAFTIIFVLISCNSGEPRVESPYLDKDLKSKVELYIEDSVDNFSKELEEDGGFFMWKNYVDYLGFGDIGFKERIHNSWNRAYDNETLELFINTELAKKGSKSSFKIEKNLSEVGNYNWILLFPFIMIAFDELLIWIILFLIVEFIVIPFVAKRTIKKQYKAKGFWSYITLDFLYNAERQNRIDIRVKKIKKIFNLVLIIFLLIFTLFYFDFSESLNKELKVKIKKDIIENINIKIKNHTN